MNTELIRHSLPMRALIWIGAAIGIAVFFPAVGAFMLDSPIIAVLVLVAVVLTIVGGGDSDID